ncbi:RNA-directed DNA polymerase [Enterobacter asburiae]|uniref:RNA-directed DNA polymerase n=1 Tax=Enterobacter asburiae TaxID=61645 RepID=UPI00396708D1
MTLLENLLTKGYFPKEALSPFSTEKYARAIANGYDNLPPLFRTGKFISKCAFHNISRKGTLRRKLGIPNPVNFFRLSETITENWHDILECASKSTISLTTPDTASNGNRAFNPRFSLNELPEIHAKLRSKHKYILKTDISRFYHSIYTHSIAWTYHTKDIAKKNRSNGLFGNLLDKHLQDSQDGQTIGIPIGPDTSLIIAESLLANIDLKLSEKGISSGLRYIDDYFLGFNTIGEAESALTTMQELLNEYELALNPLKTEIIQLPVEFEPLAISELRAFSFRDTIGGQKSDLIHYFNIAFKAAKDLPTESILKYAVSRTFEVNVTTENYPVFENFILQCVTADSSTLKYTVNQLIKYKRIGYIQNIENISHILRQLSITESSLGHGNEVAYCLWLYLVLGISVPEVVVKNVVPMRDPFVAILLCDCWQKGLMNFIPDFSIYEEMMVMEELSGDMWMFVYEMLAKEWFQPTSNQNPISQNECYRFLLNSGVFFYNEHLSSTIMAENPIDTDGSVEGFSG